MGLAWAAPAPAAQIRPMKSRTSSVLVAKLGKNGFRHELAKRAGRGRDSPKELGEGRWGDLYGFSSWGCLYGVMFDGLLLLGGGIRVLEGVWRGFFGEQAATWFLLVR